jgi:hypothetical protein
VSLLDRPGLVQTEEGETALQMGRAKDKSRMCKLVAKVNQLQCKDEVAMGVCKTVNIEREGWITSVEVKYECDGMNNQYVMEGNSSREAELNKT